jgi:hypothetical protein
MWLVAQAGGGSTPHPFYRRLNQMFDEVGSDSCVYVRRHLECAGGRRPRVPLARLFVDQPPQSRLHLNRQADSSGSSGTIRWIQA